MSITTVVEACLPTKVSFIDVQKMIFLDLWVKV